MASSNDQQQFSDLEVFEQTAIDALARLRSHVEASSRGQQPASGYAPLARVLDNLEIERWIVEGGMNRASFDAFLERYLQHSVQLHHPAHVAHQVSVPDYPAALAALVNGVTNNPMAIYEMGPAAAAIEFAVVNWMLTKVGWTPQPLSTEPGDRHGAGVLTHGGSLANLTAMLAARARIAPAAWDDGSPRDLAVLVPETSHYSNARALSILGLGSRSVYPLAVTDAGVIRADQLDAALARVHADGRRCMALVANACSTATGLHDPLQPIGEFCASHDIWFHADACHGATALLSKHSKHLLSGIELADSVAWDAHKMMQVPVICAAVLFRDSRHLDHAFHTEASYLAHGEDKDSFDSLQRAVECTKAALGFKIFLNLAWRGEVALGDYVDERYAAAKRFYEIIKARPGFHCPYEPESNILCFRFGTDDAALVRIRGELMREGRFHITSALVNGTRYLRLTVMNKLTDVATIESLLDAIEEKANSYKN